MSNTHARVGDVEIIALVDAVPAPVDPAWSFPDVAPEALSGIADGSLNPDGRFQPNLGCFLLRLPGSAVLVDAGIGPGPNDYLGGLTGHLPERLAAERLSTADIDVVIFTHLHMDHVGWSVTQLGGEATSPTFANADHFVGAAELAYWLDPDDRALPHHRDAVDRCIQPLATRGSLRTVSPDEEILPGVSLAETPGHTPGHSSVRVRTKRADLVIAGDVMHCPAQAGHPSWCHRADMDPALAAKTRARFLKGAVEEGWTIAACHFRDGLQIGRVERGADSYRWRPHSPVSD